MRKIFPDFKLSLFLLIINFSNPLFSQQYAVIDDLIKTYPNLFSTPEKLAEKINTDFRTEEEKSRAIFTWIASHIKYDLNLLNSIKNNSTVAFSYTSEEEKIIKQQKFHYDLAAKTLKTKKGVCENYAALFQTLCDLTSVKCITIAGTSKTHSSHIGLLPKASDHLWNAVKIGSSWRLIDVTWASGSVNNETGKFVQEFNDAYFFTTPEVFFLNHFPDDKRLSMLPKTEEDFAKLPLYYPGYLKSNYEIVAPEDGIISISKSNAVSFKIIDLPEKSKVSYAFSSENIGRQVELRRLDNLTEFEIFLNRKSYGYLTIYVNTKSIVTYKITR